MKRILVVEDDRTFGRIIEGFLRKQGFDVVIRTNGRDGVQAIDSSIAAVLLDYRLPDQNGIEILPQIQALQADLPVIIMTGFSDIRTAVAAMKLGAREYITKPINPDELLQIIHDVTRTATPSTRTATSAGFIEGTGPASRELHEHIRVVAPTDFTVVIEGESGTGKENIARTIHRLSTRQDQPFVAVDCGALSKELAASELFGHAKGAFTGAVADKKGHFEAAQGGTLFLDEVGNLSYEVQMKLLRAIQERTVQPLGSARPIKVDIRLITATHEDLRARVTEGVFREDLYHRLNEFKLYVPPLRQRKDDLPAFAGFFRDQACAELHKPVLPFSVELMTVFNQYEWPGNLRELRNVVRRAVLLAKGQALEVDLLPPEMITSLQQPAPHSASPYDLKALSEAQERELIARTLTEVKYNKSKAARLLNIDRKTLYLKMEKYNIQ